MNYFYEMLISMVIGVIEGVIEFLPISSTGHIIIICHWLKLDNNNTKILAMFMQLGSALATFCFFYKKIIKIFSFNIKKNNKNIHIFYAVSPTIFLGLILYKQIKLLFNINNVMHMLILGGIFLIVCEILKPKKYKISHINEISIFQSLVIGIFQSLCLFPGFSRSGSTIATGILLGLKRAVAIEFSFIISIPLSIGASMFDLIQNIYSIKILDCPVFLLGFIISFITSFLCIKKLLNIINKTSLIFFGIYRFIISGILYLMY